MQIETFKSLLRFREDMRSEGQPKKQVDFFEINKLILYFVYWVNKNQTRFKHKIYSRKLEVENSISKKSAPTVLLSFS